MPDVASTAARRRLEAAALFLVLVALGLRFVASASQHAFFPAGPSAMLYPAATIGYGWQDVGFVRRGLGGTIVGALPLSRLAGTALFHALWTAALAAVFAAWHLRLRAPPAGRLAFAAIALALFGRWGEDPGRTDVPVMACIGVAAWLVVRGREGLAALVLAAALCFHESAYIVGLPLLVAAAALGDPRRPWRGDRGVAVAILLAGFGVYAASSSLSATQAATIVRVVHERLPDSPSVDWALYFALAGGRTVATSICQNLADPNYALHVASGLVLIAVTIVVLVPARRDARLAAAFAALVPYAFLCVVASDLSRWAVFAMANAWLIGAACGGRDAGARRWAHAALALALVPLTHPKAVRVPYPDYAPSPAIERLATELGGPRTPPVSTAIELCEPGWREVLAALGRP